MKKKKRENKIKLIIITLVLLFISSFCAAYYYFNKDNKINNKSTIQKVKKDKGNDTLKEKKDKIIENKEPAKYVVYDILGKSKFLTEKEAASMQEWRSSVKTFGENNQKLVFLNGQPSKKAVCLTFDDGPDNVITPKIIDVLNSNNVKGNFMFLGQYAQSYPSVVKKAFDGGHIICSHGYDHKYEFTKITTDALKFQINKTDDVIFKETGKYPLLVRPPYGSINDNVNSCLNGLNKKIILWSIDTLDWSQKEPSNIIKNVTDNLRPGEIILMHSNSDKQQTLNALPELIKKIKENGYDIITLDRMLDCDAYK